MIRNNQFPQPLMDKWKELYSEKDYNQLQKNLTLKKPISFRTNTLKINSAGLEKVLIKKGFVLKKVSWYLDAFILENKTVRELTETDEYKNGLLYIQNLSSMIPSLVLDPQQDEKILDVCAAPGSKTTQIAALTKMNAQIIANDSSRQRLYKMESILKNYGIPYLKNPFVPIHNNYLMITNFRGEQMWKRLPEYFDKTLVDVPCSMEGRIQFDDPKTYQDWTAKKVKMLAQLQKYLLRSAISATKIGGTIVYSTCTLSPEENEEVIEWVIEKTPHAVQVESININKLQLQKGIKKWKKKKYTHTQNCKRVFPNETMEGFFIAKIKKVASTIE